MKKIETEKRGLSTMTSSIEFADNYNFWIIEKFSPFFGNRILEIGTGHGNFKKFISNYDLYVSCDIDKAVIQKAKNNDVSGIYMETDVCSNDFVSKMCDFGFDTIICVNVIEHIKNDKKAISNMMASLIHGGHLLLFVPAFQLLYNDLDLLAGHYRRYYKGNLLKLLRFDSCQIKLLQYFNSLGGIGWLMNRLFSHKDLDSANINRQMQLFDKYGVPISRKLDMIFHNIFGQSVICVIKKKEVFND